MSLPNPSAIERHILDLLDRIERRQEDRIEALENRGKVLEDMVQALQKQTMELRRRSERMEAKLRAQDSGITALSNSLDDYLGLPGSPPVSGG